MSLQIGHRRLTVVDDSAELLALFGDALRADGVDIALFDASVSLSEIADSDPDLIVIDLHLGPDTLTGLDIIRLVRAHRHLGHVPIIACSAAPDVVASHRAELDLIPHVSLLSMPFSLSELDACVASALRPYSKAAAG